MYVVQSSVLTKLRLPEWQQACLENPKLLYSPEPFSVRIPRASGDVTLIHKKITPGWELLKKNPNRVTDEDEITPLVNWLTDEHNTETDIWGVVAIKVGDDITNSIMTLMMENDKERVKEMMDDTQSKMRQEFAKAQKIADERVMRACGRIYNVVKSTVEDMKKNNKGIYDPSFSEALCFEVMKDTIRKRSEPHMKAKEMMDNAFSALVQPV